MCDKLVFDLAQEVEGQPSVFIRKDWINCLDNQNQNYNGNQSILDTSQLSNSNKYMSYRESYLSIPFLLTLGSFGVEAGPFATGGTSPNEPPNTYFSPATSTTSCDYAIGLKNWFGQIIHSFTLDYNGTTIIQQTPFINMWNSFKLITSLSLDDVYTQGATIGFYPDDPLTWEFYITANVSGNGTCNNSNSILPSPLVDTFNNYKSGRGNDGYLNRQRLINFDVNASPNINGNGTVGAVLYSSLLAGGATNSVSNACNQVWKSYIFNKVNSVGVLAGNGVLQINIVATVYLKHIHGFFNMIPLLKGVFMKMTMNLNNTSTSFKTQTLVTINGDATVTSSPLSITVDGVSNPLGGVNPVLITSAQGAENGTTTLFNGGYWLYPTWTEGEGGTAPTLGGVYTQSFRMNLAVGSFCLDQQLNTIQGIQSGQLSKSIYLYIPAYTFNPVFEQAYLSSPIKTIKYTDIYQYQVVNVPSGSNFNNLITNGIANVKSVLVLPFFSANAGTGTLDIGSPNAVVKVSSNSGFLSGTPVWQSPFDTAGTGTTSPLCWLSNFNIQVSGQNAIYNTERYNFEQFNNQLYGQNAVNGGLTDGLTSGLISRQHFDQNFCYYYVNVERMLPAEQQVPKSIQLLGQNFSSRSLDLYVFVEFGVEVKIDALTGARV